MNGKNDSKLIRIGIFYDGNYFYHVSNYYYHGHQRRSRISVPGLHSLIRTMVAEREHVSENLCRIVDSHYFRGRLTAAEANLRHLLFSERNFDDVLTREGVVAHFLPVSHGSEKGANISLSLEAYEQMVHIGFDVVVLVACDGDYVPLVRKLNSLGARVMVIGWEYSYEDDNGGHRQTMTSGRLMAEATYGIWMQDVINKQLYSQDKIDALFVSGGGQGYSQSDSGAAPDDYPEEEEDYDEQERIPAERRCGTVVQLKSGYGFITPEKGDHDFFFLWEDLENCSFDELRIGERVEFEVGTNDRGECARRVVWLDPDGNPYRSGNEEEEPQDNVGDIDGNQ